MELRAAFIMIGAFGLPFEEGLDQVTHFDLHVPLGAEASVAFLGREQHAMAKD